MRCRAGRKQKPVRAGQMYVAVLQKARIEALRTDGGQMMRGYTAVRRCVSIRGMVHILAGVLWLVCGQTGGAPGADGACVDVDGAWQARQRLCLRGPPADCDRATDTVLATMAAAGWPGAWAYGAALAHEALAESDAARALKRADAAVTIAPHSLLSHWAQLRSIWRRGSLGGCLQVMDRAVRDFVCLRTWHEGALAPWGFWAARAALGLFTAVAAWLLGRAGPQGVHDVSHGLPGRLRPALIPVAFFATLVWLRLGPFGPIVSTSLLSFVLLPYLRPDARGKLAGSAVLAALALGALPYLLLPTLFSGSAAGARARALQDANAGWARARLPAVQSAQGDDLWTHAILARRRGDNALAQQLTGRAIAGGETHPALLVLEANLLYEGKDFSRAQAIYAQAIALDSSCSVARYNLSIALLSLADPAAAEAARVQAFDQGGGALTSQAARAQAAGRLLLEPDLPQQLLLGSAEENRMLLPGVWAAALKALTGASRPALCLSLLYGLAIAHGLAQLLARFPGAQALLARLPAPAGRCSRCHDVSCPRCAPEAADAGLCGPCHQAALATTAEGLVLRQQQEARSLAQYSLMLRLRRGVFWLLPGAGVALQRSYPVGLATAVVVLTFLQAAGCALGWLAAPWGLWSSQPGTPVAHVLAGLCAAAAAIVWLVGIVFGRPERT